MEWTRITRPSPAPSARPPGPSSTWSRCSAAGTHTLTVPPAAATSAGLPAAAAPKATAASTAAGSTSNTVTSAPAPSRFSVMAEPIMPSPM